MVTPEQQAQAQQYLKQSGYVPPTNQRSSPSGFDEIDNVINSMGQQDPGRSQAPQNFGEKVQANFENRIAKPISAVGNFLTQSEQNFGGDLAQATYSMLGGKKQIDSVTKENMDSGTQMMQIANNTKDLDRRAKLVKMAIDDFKSAGATQQDIIGTVRSKEQIFGDAGGVLLDILAAGTYGKAAEGAKSFELMSKSPTAISAVTDAAKKGVGILPGMSKGAVSGAKIGALYGGARGVVGGLQDNQGAGGVVASGLKGVAMGGLTGGALGGIGGGIAGGIKANSEDLSLLTGKDKNLQTAIDAVNPILKGKQLEGAYLSDFGRGATESGLLTKQAPAVSEDVQRIGANLKDVLTSSDPLTNLKSLGNEMDKTESQLSRMLLDDKTPVVKEGITSALEDLKTQVPREYQGIKEQQGVFDKMVDYAKEQVNNTTPDMAGIRNARIALDNAAKTEFPSAFKNGYVNVSTPAGRALKLVRDTMNDYLYNTAEQGSEVQNLIGKENDLFRARQSIVPKAMAVNGKSVVTKFLKAHPFVSRVVKVGAAGLVGGEILKTTGLLP